ncbi:sensor histidine kinase [Marivirga sericea]|uniref:sensor histidine kinase n=1 Tax=Marivirga sericea TaxID=1028 RepID=UPI00111C6D31|nr:HAMP domain-containing sensor histidine kinase [Marivirga sericea]
MSQSKPTEDRETISTLLKEADENWHNNIPKAQRAAAEAFSQLNSETSPLLKAEAYAQYGISFYTDLNYDSAIFYYKKATEVAAQNGIIVHKYMAITTSAMSKTGRFMDVINLANKRISQLRFKDAEYYKLLMIKLSASISLGSTEKSKSIITILDQFKEDEFTLESRQKAYKLKAKYYHLTAQYQKSDSLLSILLQDYIDPHNKMDAAEIHLLLAQNAMEISQYKRSSELLLAAKTVYDSLGYEFGQANVNLFTGSLLSWMGQYNDASDYIFEALRVFEKNGNQNETMIAYYELGWIFFSMQMEERAKKYLKQSIVIARNISNLKYLGNVHNAYGSLYTDLKKYDSANFYFDSSIYYQEITQNIRSIAAAKFNKAIVLEKLGKDQEALDLYRYGYKVDEKFRNTIGLIEGDWILGEYFMKKNQLDSAQYYFRVGEKRAKGLGEKYFLLKILEAQSNLNSRINNHLLASQYLKEALKTQKELSEENTKLELATLETTYDLKNKEKELSLLNLQKENNEQTIALNQKTIESQRNTLILLTIGILILLILSYIIFRYLKIRTKTNHQLRDLNYEIQEKQEEIVAQSEELKEANDHVHELNEFLEKRVKDRTLALEEALSELDHFFYRASHDFRGPLTTLMGLVSISRGYILSEEATVLFDKVNITVKKLDSLVKKLQAVSLLGDFENFKSPKILDLENEVKQIVDDVITNKSIDGSNYNSNISIKTSTKAVLFYPLILEICLKNLIENSLIFNYSTTVEIEINVVVEDDELMLSVHDNGIGISDEMQKEIFSMFKRTSQISTGNGLGLYIVKKAIDILKGKIEINSNINNGSTFILKFPLVGINEALEPNNEKLYIKK